MRRQGTRRRGGAGKGGKRGVWWNRFLRGQGVEAGTGQVVSPGSGVFVLP